MWRNDRTGLEIQCFDTVDTSTILSRFRANSARDVAGLYYRRFRHAGRTGDARVLIRE
jgi:hypothetical protein